MFTEMEADLGNLADPEEAIEGEELKFLSVQDPRNSLEEESFQYPV
jgi:hypothetical protein